MRNLILSISSSVFLVVAWMVPNMFFLIFIAFLPILFVEKNLSLSNRSGLKFFSFTFIMLLIFNVFTTYWIWYSTVAGALVAFLVNSLLMSFTFLIFHKVKKNLGYIRGYISLIFLWLSMEYLHLNWEFAFPWLVIGNVFAMTPSLIQWYEFTGVLGGSLWVLIVNILLFSLWNSNKNIRRYLILLVFLLVPIFISLVIKKVEVTDHKQVVIIQPNVDSYGDKFNRDPQEQLDDFIDLARSKLTDKTQLLIGPETVLQEFMIEDYLEYSESIRKLRYLQQEFPNLNILVGSITYKKVGEKEFDSYNSTIFLDNYGDNYIYHKTKLVPGVERIPYSSIFSLLGDFAVELGGSSHTYSSDNEIFNFTMKDKDGLYNIHPLICYESVFGEILSKGLFGKPSLIAIITNDGWWGNTAGYKQHFHYAKLRAIEQRQPVVRSANTGISGVFSSSGEIIKQTKWDEEIALRVDVPVNKGDTTFYSIYGDYIGRIASFISILIILFSFVKGRIKKTSAINS